MPRRPGRSARVIFAGLALATLAGCPSKPPPPPPPPPPAPAPPPPPPPCEELTEKCKAKKSTLIPIPTSRWVFNPPKGWVYAKYDDASVAEADEAPGIIMADIDPARVAEARRATGVSTCMLTRMVVITPP